MSFTPWEIMAFVVGACGFVLTVLNIIDKQHHFKQEADEPFNTLKARVDVHDAEIKDIKKALSQEDVKFLEMDRALKVLIRATIALVEFEMQYCLTEHKEMSKGLEKAKEALDEFVAEK